MKIGHSCFPLCKIIPWIPLLLIPLAILAVIILLLFSTHIDYIPRTTAQAQMAEIMKALDFYKMDRGHYPSTSEGLWALLRLKQGSEEVYIKEIPKDPWGYPYHYESDGKDCKITSYGSDGKKGKTWLSKDSEDIVVSTQKKS